MRLPDPIANTTTEAYLAYKAGVLSEGELKPKLYDPYIHLDAWLAYWAGLTDTYPVKGVGKNLFNITSSIVGGINGNTGEVSPNPEIAEVTKTDTSVVIYSQTNNYKGIVTGKIAVSEGEKLTLSWGRGEETTPQYVAIFFYGDDDTFLSRGEQIGGYSTVETTGTAPSGAAYARCAMEVRNAGDTVTFYNIMLEKSASATSFEPYTGEPEMLTDEEAFIAYLSGVTDTYPEEFRDPADIRVAAYLRYLISGRWGRPEYPVNNEEFYLSLMKTKFIPSGDPSSDIVIDGTAKAPFVDVKMYGDTFQQTYTGKNLLQFIPRSGEGMTTTYDTGTGLAHVSGTNRSNDGKWANICESVECSIPAGTYTLSVTEAQNNLDFHIRLRYTDDSTGDFYILKNNTSKTFDMPKDAKRVYIWYGGLTPTFSSVDFTVGIQLEKSATATTFEPYVGGVPSPNPDYPQPIQTVTGEQTVEIVGKNLFDKNTSTPGVLDGDGTIGSAIDYFTSDFIRVVPETMYHKTQTTSARFKFYNINKTPISSVYDDIPSAGDAKSFTTPSNCYYIRFSFKFNTKNSIQIELGSTATAYAPYNATSYPINLGKNLFDKTKVTNGYYIDENGMLQVSARFGYSDYIPVIAGQTYTYSGATNNSSYAGKGAWYDADKQWLSSQSFGVSGQITAPSGAAYYRTTIRIEYSSNQEPYLDTYQLEVGSTATTYAPYFEPIELCKLGTYQDYIWKDGEDWKVHKETRKYIFTGDSNIDDYIFNADTGTSVAVNLVPLKYDQPAIKIGSSPSGLSWGASDKFRFTSSSGDDKLYLTSAYSIGDDMWRANIRLYLSETRLPGYSASMTNSEKLALVTTWISDNQITTYFIPRTGATDTTITDQTLIAQLEALVSGGAENGTTYIKVDATDPNLPGLLYVEAPKYE